MVGIMVANNVKHLTKKAYQGNITAIRQLLNGQLQETGVQTKVTLGVNGTLEILCEADHPENLDKDRIVPCIRHNLDQLSPRPFREVHIQSCLIKEEQSLWVSSLSHTARQNLLWSVDLEIQPLPWLQRALRTWGLCLPTLPPMPRRESMTFSALSSLTKPTESLPIIQTNRSPQFAFPSSTAPQHIKLILGAIAVGCCGWLVHDWWQLRQQSQPLFTPITIEENNLDQHHPASFDPFSEAIRLATQAAAVGQTATTYGQWLDLANRWQRASALMALVTPDHPHYGEAQTRVLSYRQNSTVALAKAEALAP